MGTPKKFQALPNALLAALALLSLCHCKTYRPEHAPVRTRALSLPYPEGGSGHYDTASTGHPDGDGNALAAALVQRAASEGRTLHVDGRLSILAAWANTHREGGALPPQGAIDAAAHHLGLVEPTPAMVVLGAGPDADMTAKVSEELAPMLRKQRTTHVGVFIERTQQTQTAVVVLAGRHLDLQPLPRELPLQNAIEIRGALAPGYARPELIVMRPGGAMDRSPISGADGAADFGARARLGAAGRYDIELLAQGPTGLTVVANFPVFVGQPAPPRIELDVPVGGDADADVEGALLSLINQSRADAGLPPVKRRADVDAVALGHSQDMIAHDFVGHTSPTTGEVDDRVRAAGIQSPLAAENIGRAYSAAGIHAGLMASPGHRANILHERATHVGIGVVEQPEGTQIALLATQVFIEVVSPLDPEAAARDGLAALNAARADKGLRQLEQVAALSELARDAAEAYFSAAQPPPEAAAKRVYAGIDALGLTYARYQALTVVGSRVDLSALAGLHDPQARAIGVGFAQGERDDAASNPVTIALVVLAYD